MALFRRRFLWWRTLMAKLSIFKASYADGAIETFVKKIFQTDKNYEIIIILFTITANLNFCNKYFKIKMKKVLYINLYNHFSRREQKCTYIKIISNFAIGIEIGTSQWARKLKKVQTKKLVKSKKSISRKKIL